MEYQFILVVDAKFGQELEEVVSDTSAILGKLKDYECKVMLMYGNPYTIRIAALESALKLIVSRQSENMNECTYDFCYKTAAEALKAYHG